MGDPERNSKPPVPAIIARLELDTSAKDYKKQLLAAAAELEKELAAYQVTEFVIARQDRDTKVVLSIIPCASAPELRGGAPASTADAAPEQGTTKAGIADALDRAARPSAVRAEPGPAAAKGLAPKQGGGVGLRRR